MTASSSERPIRVRMAPSPTGPLHIGTARTTLFNWLFARHNKSTFVLRIEDTDKERSKKEYEKEQIEGLNWLGIDWDEGPTLEGDILASKGNYGPYRDSERIEDHKKYIQKFLDEGKAYQCYCTKEELDAAREKSEKSGVPFLYPRTCRDLVAPPAGKVPQAIRLKMPDETISFDDMVRGVVSFEPSHLDDFVIARSDGSPLYNLSVAIDDYEMKITHVIRGEDHISNTPKQIGVYRALGVDPPRFAHIPLILNPDRSKMSKRFGDTTVAEYRKRGYLPDALINFIALLGWHPSGDDEEVMTRDQAVLKFDIARVQKAGAVFDQDKLDWLNGEYIKKTDSKKLAELAAPFFEKAGIQVKNRELLEKVIGVEKNRAKTLQDFAELGKFFFVLPDYESALLIWKDAKKEEILKTLNASKEVLAKIAPADFTRGTFLGALSLLIEEKGKGTVLWPLRVALSGQDKSPDPTEIMEVLGKDESLARIALAEKKLG